MGMRFSVFHFFILSAIIFGRLSAEISRKELRTKEAEGQQMNRGSRGIDAIDPSRVTQLAWQPRVFLYRSFLSDEECDHLISRLQGTISNSSGDLKMADAKDEVVERIEERISAWTFIPKENGRPLQVLHFDSEESKGNHDYYGQEFIALPSEPLMATVILYLSNVSRGGQILFPESKNEILSDCTMSGLALRPAKGNAIVFFNTHLNASPDKSSSHARCPLLGGDMWCATKIFQLRDISREKDAKPVDGPDCTDEDENCPRWAATGECQKNPVFMVGSPDYYGTCRKSCNACASLV